MDEQIHEILVDILERLDNLERAEVPGEGETYTITNLSVDRAYDANSTTVAELADVLGTLITDLASKKWTVV